MSKRFSKFKRDLNRQILCETLRNLVWIYREETEIEEVWLYRQHIVAYYPQQKKHSLNQKQSSSILLNKRSSNFTGYWEWLTHRLTILNFNINCSNYEKPERLAVNAKRHNLSTRLALKTHYLLPNLSRHAIKKTSNKCLDTLMTISVRVKPRWSLSKGSKTCSKVLSSFQMMLNYQFKGSYKWCKTRKPTWGIIRIMGIPSLEN